MLTQAVPAVRRQFARRLREFRIVRGFKTARSLAGALGIDENRYTRYERAEVEPDLALIQRICEILRLTPNELFGLPETARTDAGLPSGHSGGAGFSESEAAPLDAAAADPRARRDAITWTLACAVAELQAKAEGSAASDPAPLATLQRAARLFADLERRPFAAVSEILLLPAVASASQTEARRIGELVHVFARALG